MSVILTFDKIQKFSTSKDHYYFPTFEEISVQKVLLTKKKKKKKNQSQISQQ